eukprot:CAMPEP_0179145464 /NCGR_PEP_ID=MMETSP0796-20121207/70182_1 /TAXON_ID=73915 /ORGANISM="Pyrodinium bahamense, Strain pbaha01" /LENGTH=100 /DNA_ID=CAMNT_0020845853 /DNA_START=197 /DNA_END=499 /DNA_ORIENTATION=-
MLILDLGRFYLTVFYILYVVDAIGTMGSRGFFAHLLFRGRTRIAEKYDLDRSCCPTWFFQFCGCHFLTLTSEARFVERAARSKGFSPQVVGSVVGLKVQL